MKAPVAVFYGTHPNEIPSVQVGEAIRTEEKIPALPFDREKSKSRNHWHILSDGVDVVVDLHTGKHSPDDMTDDIRGYVKMDSFAIPLIPTNGKRSVKETLLLPCVDNLIQNYGVVGITKMDHQTNGEIIQIYVRKKGDTKFVFDNLYPGNRYTNFLKLENLYTRIVGIDYITSRWEHSNGVDRRTVERFKNDAYWLCSWIRYNSSRLFL